MSAGLERITREFRPSFASQGVFTLAWLPRHCGRSQLAKAGQNYYDYLRTATLAGAALAELRLAKALVP